MYTKDLTRPHLKEKKERVNIVKRKRKGLIVTLLKIDQSLIKGSEHKLFCDFVDLGQAERRWT